MSLRKVINNVLIFSMVAMFVAVGHAPPAQALLGAQRLGQVHFSISCTEAAQKFFDRGVALLHSFWYLAGRDSYPRRGQPDT